MNLTKEEILAEIIVDLYEMRASTISPLQARQMEKVQNLFQYSFFTTAIAQLCDKHKISNEDIEQEIRERAIKKEIHPILWP